MFDSYEDALLTDYVFDSNLSTREIAHELDKSEVEVKKRIRDLGLSWIRRRNGHLSRGQAALVAVMKKLLPGAVIRTEEPIGERLRLDVYCPTFQLAAEYNGQQHYKYVQHFHGNKDGFYESQLRDERKQEICKDLGISLVVFRYTDALDEDSVYNRLYDALRNGPEIKRPEKPTLKGNPYYESWKKRTNEYRRKQYQKMKGKRARGAG